MISIIVAIEADSAIGKKGDLLCHMSAESRHVSTMTSGQTDVKGKTFEGAETVYSLDEMEAKVRPDEEAFVIGGGMVYRQMMERADKLYITHIHHSWPDADTFFPEIDPTVWKQLSAERHEADENNPYDYTFAEYGRR